MKCLNCLKPMKKVVHLKLNKYLEHLKNWNICKDCDDTIKSMIRGKVTEYYLNNKKHYRKLHKKYKAKLTDSYVANALVDRTELKAKDMPKEMIKAKKQYMKLNRIVKEKNDAKN